MDGNCRNTPKEGSGAPSEAWLFAQALRGKPIPNPAAEASRASAERERLEWLASISTEHEKQLRRLQSAEAEARRKRELLTWLASFSTEHERQLRRIQAAEAEAALAQRNYERFAESADIQEANWDPAKHPRGGFPQNRGWWSPSGGSGAPSATTPTATKLSERPAEQSDAPSTKPQLPADRRGTWISGTKGDGVFRYNNSVENQEAGIAGKEVRFESQHIAVGGFPPEAYYRGSSEAAGVEITTYNGTDADSTAADEAMRRKLRDPNWQRPAGFRWNHAGPPGSKVMELVAARYHKAVSHKGWAAELRAARRGGGPRGAAKGRALGVLTVYLAVRDVLQVAGVLQPDYSTAERETYHFVAEDGSVFVVRPKGWFSGPAREYVDGPRKGETESITDADVDEYRKIAEAEWGKYIPGTLISGPRFIPGKNRKKLPLMIVEFGVPREAGWIDEDGVHYYPTPKPART